MADEFFCLANKCLKLIFYIGSILTLDFYFESPKNVFNLNSCHVNQFPFILFPLLTMRIKKIQNQQVAKV